MRVPYNYLPRQFAAPDEILRRWRELIESSEYTLGPYVEEFESRFAAFQQGRFCVSTNCGTDALILSLRALEIGQGDSVITPCNSFYATTGAIVAVGATPVFCDVDDRYQISLSSMQDALQPTTKAVLPVHWAGASPDMLGITKWASEHGLRVVEDACMAIGGQVHGAAPGSFGDLGAFSMHPLKTLNAIGDGGMVITSDPDLANWMRKYRNHGMSTRDEISIWGVNMRMQPLQAIVGSLMIESLNERLHRRLENQRLLDAALAHIDGIQLPPRELWNVETVSLYMIRVQNRDKVLRMLIEREVEAKVHYPTPLHMQPPAQRLGYRQGDFPNAEQQAREIITLPAHEYLTADELNYMIECVATVVAESQ